MKTPVLRRTVGQVSENSTVKTGLPEDGVDERRNASEYQCNVVSWCVRSGAVNEGRMNITANKTHGRYSIRITDIMGSNSARVTAALLSL